MDGGGAAAYVSRQIQSANPGSISMSIAGQVSAAPATAREASGDGVVAIRIWLWSVAVLVLAMVVVGGATRLTESGLSITQWNPISGVLPPMSDAAWQAEFDGYKQIPQYSQMFPNMSLGEFKFIFFWEWSHRLLGRLIGAVFALPLAWFWLRGRLSRAMKWQFTAVLALGGLQGFVGWWMVKSGLADRVEVAPERLAPHLLLASITFVAVVWLATGLREKPIEQATSRQRFTSRLLVWLTLVQLGLGALVAGLRAGLTYNTWPLMDGRFIPPADHLANLQPLWRNLFENVTTVQFDHRMVAYGLLALAIWHAFAIGRARGDAVKRRAVTLAAMIVVQAGLGITTLLMVLPEGRIPLGPALAHQAFALMVLGMATVHARRLGQR